jgi:hypothetical protein
MAAGFYAFRSVRSARPDRSSRSHRSTLPTGLDASLMSGASQYPDASANAASGPFPARNVEEFACGATAWCCDNPMKSENR